MIDGADSLCCARDGHTGCGPVRTCLFGASQTGLVLAQLLVHGGAARVTVATPTEFKLELARHFGVDRTIRLERQAPEASMVQLRTGAPEGYDAVIEATGALSSSRRCASRSPVTAAPFSSMA